MANEDMRVQRTKRILKDNFKELFLEKDYDTISVKELCDRAMINRRTFYLHYNSLDDLMEEILEDMSLEFLEYTKDYDHFKEIHKIIKDYYVFTNSNSLYEKLNNDSNLDYIRERLNNKVKNNVTDEFNSISYLDKFEYNIARIYLNTIAVNTYRYWSKTGKKENIDDVVDFTAMLVENGLKSVSK